MVGEDALAVGVEIFGDGADTLFLWVVCRGEWKWIEALTLCSAVDPPASTALRKRPRDMDTMTIGHPDATRRLVNDTTYCRAGSKHRETGTRDALSSPRSRCNAAGRPSLVAIPVGVHRKPTSWSGKFVSDCESRSGFTVRSRCWYTSGNCRRTCSASSPNRSMTTTPRGGEFSSLPLRYSRMCRSRSGRLPSPRCSASFGVTINPEPCSLTPARQIPSFACSEYGLVTSTPMVKSAFIDPFASLSSTIGCPYESALARFLA